MAWLVLMTFGICFFLIGLISFLNGEPKGDKNFRDIAGFMAIGDAFLILSALIRQAII